MPDSWKEQIVRYVLPRVQTPGQYIGGELNAVVKGVTRGRLCFAFPDTYSIGMSHHGLQVLYAVMNGRADWACERVFAPMVDMEAILRERQIPLCSLETFRPLDQFDVLGFTLQYDLVATNVLTILDLGRIPLAADARSMEHPLVIAGGPCTANPEPMSRFIDAFLVGDGEEALPQLCDLWLELKSSFSDRGQALAELGRRLPFVYVPRHYSVEYGGLGRPGPARPMLQGLPEIIEPAVVADLDAIPLPTRPVVPFVECVQDRIAIEIMRGCPNRCRFCQSATTKRPVRMRRVDTIVQAALESYRTTGLNDLSLLSLSTSDYPYLDELLPKLQEVLRPLGVSVSLPSLRINEQLRTMGDMLNTDKSSGLTLAPEAARDEMRRRIGKLISNDDLYAGIRTAMENGFQRVKLYFMCGLPGETQEDLDGIVEMTEVISRLGKEVQNRFALVVASVSNFVPKPQTPFQWQPMQTREYLIEAHKHLRSRARFRSTQLKWHDVDTSLLEGLLARADRRFGTVIEAAWRVGARFDAWSDHFRPGLWWNAIAESGLDWRSLLHAEYPAGSPLPWDHIAIRQGRELLCREAEAARLL